MTALLEYFDLFDALVKSAASCSSSLLPQNANIFLILTHTYYAQNYAGIIASSLSSCLAN